MDDRQFDTISRSLAKRTSRRQALRSGGAGAAVLGFLGFGAARSAVAQDDDVGGEGQSGLDASGICRLDFDAEVRMGPSAGSDQSAKITGQLAFRLDDKGGITQGVLQTADGENYQVVGQGSGRSLALRIHIGDDVLVAVGAGDQLVSDCAGEYGGPASGPVRGDLGDWIATASGSGATATATAGAGAAPTQSSAQPTAAGPTATADCSGVTCDPAFMVDPVTCECVCYDNGVACGQVCCPAGYVCNDESSGNCSCPSGSQACNATCVTCQAGEILDMNSCTCMANPCPQGGQQCNGVCVDTVNDRNNCGACGSVCAQGVPCIAGNCVCPPGYSGCSDGCKDLASDASNCGACGKVCGGGQSCSAGVCG
jgi:hypothetical protein